MAKFDQDAVDEAVRILQPQIDELGKVMRSHIAAFMVPPRATVPAFGPNAPWNVPVSGLTTDPNSTELARAHYDHSTQADPPKFFLNNGSFDGKFTYPVYDERTKTGDFPITLTNPGFGNLHNRTGPWNDAWAIPLGTDKEAVIINPTTGEEWDYWKIVWDSGAEKLTLGNGALVQVAEFPETSFGDPGDYRTKENGWRSTHAIGIQALATLVLAEEVQSGVVKHALGCTIFNADGCEAPAPATKLTRESNPCGTNNDRVPIGTRFALNVTDTEITNHLNTLPGSLPQIMIDSLRVIAVALRDYGWFCVDHGGGPVKWRMEHMDSGGTIWNAIEMDDRVVDGKEYPREGLDGLITKARIFAIVPSDEY